MGSKDLGAGPEGAGGGVGRPTPAPPHADLALHAEVPAGAPPDRPLVAVRWRRS
ncbi:hypothetical protein [Streptomyces sp. NBC_01800]|uniref:hypothetical protein n=1 Tax=unclassified Streptomyces TaxID=2593676 RepID=UPI002DDB9CD3|nr:hypothetical protein [Streptomyces sp. NBC_01800]WSA66133.1 hypothetical protein OIE65_03470 [Streptomyces sp. NBC_01800]WSA74734.1 hypothetical protein OG930_03385 [Streptomyces sp. NBC_01799]